MPNAQTGQVDGGASAPLEAPQYRVLHETFIAPFKIKPGSIIETHSSPGPHLDPLNDAARAKFELWLNEEYDETNERTGEKTGHKVRPHLKYRPVEYVASDAAEVRIVAEPPKETPGSLDISLAAAQYMSATPWARPGPANPPTDKSGSVLPAQGEISLTGETKILETPPISTPKR